MAAPKGNKNGVGNSGGKLWNKENRDKAAKLKGLVLDDAIRIMESEDPEDESFKKQIILKLVNSCVPQEIKHSGSDDESAKPIPILNIIETKDAIPTNNSDQEDNGDEEEDKGNSWRDVSGEDD